MRRLTSDPLQILTVSEVTRGIKNALETQFDGIRIEGELSSFRPNQSGHWYFSLKDENAVLSAAMFQGANRKVRFDVKEGLRVVATGRISVYEPRGTYQLIVDDLQPAGLGALQIRFEELKRKLEAEGLFAATRKRPLPFLATRIGLVTSADGAAVRDILNVLARRRPHAQILIAPVRVQGEGAAQEIAAAISRLNSEGASQVLIVARGGGSLEDLWAFNEEIVARAIAASAIPVVSGVGHEIDFTIADFVADLRAPTPSAAAEVVTAQSEPDLLEKLRTLDRRSGQALDRLQSLARRELKQLLLRLRDPRRIISDFRLRVDELASRQRRALEQRVAAGRVREVHATRTLMSASPSLRAKDFGRRVEQLRGRLDHNIMRTTERARMRVTHCASQLRALSPLGVLERGYAIATETKSGRAVSSVASARAGQDLTVRLHDGTVATVVRAVQPRDNVSGSGVPSGEVQREKTKDSGGQGKLPW